MNHWMMPNVPQLPAGKSKRPPPPIDDEAEGSATGEPAGEPRPGLDLRPGCVYGVVTRERVDELAAELAEIKSRLNQLFTLIVGGIVVDVLLRIAGLG